MKKILITGGHLTPALALIDRLKTDKRGQIDLIFVGRKYAADGDIDHSLEYQEVSKRQIKFYNLTTGRFTRIFDLRIFFNLVKIPIGLFQALKILHKEKPDLIFSFGGYLAFPICFAGWLMKIKVNSHEQTIIPGTANRVIGYFAEKVFVAFPQSKSYFSQKKTIYSGNPLRQDITRVIKKPFDIKRDKPVIYITGGSIGSHSINICIKEILDQLTEKYIVIHQTGGTKKFSDFAALSKLKNPNYFVVKHFPHDEIGYILSQTDILVGRSGANTFFEVIRLKIPSIFIPLPWSANGEQQAHALIIKNAGAGEIFDQNKSPQELLGLIDKIIARKNDYKNQFSRLDHLDKKNALEIICENIYNQIN